MSGSRIFSCTALLLVAYAGAHAADAPYPSKPIRFILGYPPGGASDVVAPPRHVLFLTADAFGLLPPLARLLPEQINQYFLSGYTAKLAGTEAGHKTPEPTFSACFGAPFMPRPARDYAKLLRERVEAARTSVWLVNTGWTGGPYGVGHRLPIAETRRIVRAILSSELDCVSLRRDRHFGLHVPLHVHGVRPELLDPRAAYGDPRRYDEQARALAGRLIDNYAQHEFDETPQTG